VTVEIIAIGLTLLLHFVGAGVLVWGLLDGEKIDWRGALWPRDEDGPGWDPPEPPEPPTPDRSGGLPLPVTAPSAVRLREPGRISDAKPAPGRRPAHAPERDRPAVPTHVG
jgi:hypothetical protein